MCEMTRSCSAPIDPAAIHSMPVALGQKDVSQTLTRQNSLAGRGVWTLLFVSVLTGVGLAEGLGLQSAHAADLQYPLAVTTTADGPIFLGDRNLPGVWKLQDNKLSLYFEGSKKFRTPLNAVRCLTIDAQGRLLAGDSATRQVYRFDDKGQPQPLAGKGVGIGIPMAIAVHRSGEIYVADLEIHRIMKLPADGGEPAEVAEIAAPRGLTIDKQDRIWVLSHGADHVERIETDGKVTPVVKGRPFNFAHNIVVDEKDNAYVVDGYEKCVWKFDGKQVVKLTKTDQFKNPVGLCWKGDKLLVCDPQLKKLFSVTTEGQVEEIPLPKPE